MSQLTFDVFFNSEDFAIKELSERNLSTNASKEVENYIRLYFHIKLLPKNEKLKILGSILKLILGKFLFSYDSSEDFKS